MINTLGSLLWLYTLRKATVLCFFIYRYKNPQTLIPVEANYILWEMNGRTDFHYRATMEKVN